MNTHKCRKCHKVLKLNCFSKSKRHKDGYATLCNACKTKYNVAHRKKIRDAVFNAYGGRKCKCCGETEPLFLTMDHINNDGAKQRKLIGSGTAMYCYIRRHNFPKEFQVLCLNCNAGRYRNGGICPHKQM